MAGGSQPPIVADPSQCSAGPREPDDTGNMPPYMDTALGYVFCVWIITASSTAQSSTRTRRQSSIYFRESPTQSGFRFQEEPRWSSPSDRLHSRSSVIHDPGPSWSSPARDQQTWDSRGRSDLRHDGEGRSRTADNEGRSAFKFDNDDDSSFRGVSSPDISKSPYFGSEGRSNFKFGHEDASSFRNPAAQEISKSTFKFENSEERSPSSGFQVEGRTKSSEDTLFGFRPEESNEALGNRNSGLRLFSDNSSSKRDSSEDSPWKSSEETSMFLSGSSRPKHFGRQSKVSSEFNHNPSGSSFEFPSSSEDAGATGSGRFLSPDTVATISETLGAINTVGRYLVNYTRGGHPRPSPDRLDPPTRPNEDVPGALLTISKNVLGRNVTNSIAPLVRVLPIGTETTASGGSRACTTPGGGAGYCDDLSNCPQLLLDLGNLRQSICFKSLFVPGVCCPRKGSDTTFLQEVTTTRRPVIITSSIPLQTAPTQASYTTTATPPNSIDYDFNSGECGKQEVPKFRVVGGEEALPGRWPWMAAIFLHGPRRTEFWCGGSLIGSRHILTAAHCTKDTRQRPFQARQFTVRLGDIDLKREDEPSSPQTYRVTEVRAHPRFSRVGFYNDIAVLVLDRPVRRSRFVIPVCLPSPTYRSERFIGEQPTVVGWGTTYYGGKESTVQRQVALPVWKNEDCDRTYFQPINENFICAGLKEGGKDACQGDSGGPLILKKNGRWMQIGIVSFGNKCGEPGYPGVYTRITQYIDWISSNMVT